jgi:lipid II:glycine glycyltransferase (peptidoglycan interpeptide bridge formation enzyme)
VQPPDTVVVDLSGGEESVLPGMRQKTRYNVRLAEKRGVTVATFVGEASRRELPRWYRLYEETAARDRITIHPMAYYDGVFAAAEEVARAGAAVPTLALLLASHEEDLLGGVVLASWHGMTTYLYGASSNRKRNLMASYLLQWEGMRWAVARGDNAYDLFGIPPADDPSHPMHGLYRFKTGFGGEIIHRPGCWDLDLSPTVAGTYRTAERLRGWYHYRVRKRGRG